MTPSVSVFAFAKPFNGETDPGVNKASNLQWAKQIEAKIKQSSRACNLGLGVKMLP
jgi:hypothetical protein